MATILKTFQMFNRIIFGLNSGYTCHFPFLLLFNRERNLPVKAYFMS